MEVPVLVAQLVVTTLSVTGGALLALLLDRGKGRRTEKSAELNALRLLIIEIASRRALSERQQLSAVNLDRADTDSDLNRVLRSVVLLRKEVRLARRSLRPKSPGWTPLNAMVAACNALIESVDEHPATLVPELVVLRTELDELTAELCAHYPRDLEFQAAGSAAYRRPTTTA